MKLLLTGTVLGKAFRAALVPGENRVGSAPGNDVRIVEPTVSRHHAVLDVGSHGVTVRDLASSNGTRLDGHVVRPGMPPRPATAGASVAFGSVELSLEAVADDDLEPAARVRAPGSAGGDPGSEPARPSAEPAHPGAGQADSGADRAPGTTLGIQPLDTHLLRRLPELLEAAWSGAGEATVAARAGAAVLELLPLEFLRVERRGGLLFTAGRDGGTARGLRIERAFGELEARATLGVLGAERAAADAVDLLLRLVAIAGRRGGGTERGPSRASDPPPMPDPPSLHPEVRRIYRDAARVARGTVSVLILGESGTGKEVLARYVHAASSAPADRFVALNCAALPRDLLEAELFGVERGAATGVEARPGRFELAHGGTLFLDEVGDMAPGTQARVLRVIQEGACHRLGGTEQRPARSRIVSATNQDLPALLADGRFRVDLYHRIAGWEVTLPPLRERRADVANLAAHFLEREAGRLGIGVGGISRRALRALERFDWPGNIRQLEQEIARAALFLEDGDLLDSRALAPRIAGGAGEAGEDDLKARLARWERIEIEAALAEASGEVARAAESLGLHRATLYRRMKALGIRQD